MTIATASAVQIEPMRDGQRDAWRRSLDASANGTLYHDPAFSAIYAYKVESVAHLWFRSEGRIIGQLAAGLLTDGADRVLKSPFSSSFGGIAVACDLTLGDAVGVVDALMCWARDAGVTRIELQQPPSAYAVRVDDTLEFALRRAGFRQAATELCLYIDSLGGLDDTVKRNVRKAVHAGCAFGRTTDAGGVWDFLSALKARKGQPFSIGRDDFLALAAAFPDAVCCWEVARAGVRLAALIAYRLNRRAMLGFQWGHLEEAQHLRPVDLLLHHAAEAAFSAGCRVFDFGTTTLRGEPSWGVTQFKTKFGTAGMERRQMVLSLAAEA